MLCNIKSFLEELKNKRIFPIYLILTNLVTKDAEIKSSKKAERLLKHFTETGCYDFGQSRGFVTNANGEVVFYKSALVSGIGGVIGQFLASPFYMVKTHLQAQAVEAIAVGHQHDHGKMTDAFRTIFKTQGVKKITSKHRKFF